MNARYCAFSIVLVLPILVLSGACAFAIDSGDQAPPFELARLDGAASVRSVELFPGHDRTFLVFWRSGCPHCVEALAACERFYRVYGGESITVVGINADEGDRLGARGIVEANGITFTQGHDAGGMTSDRYGVPYETFAVFLVGRDSRVIDVRIDPQGNVDAAMEEMLALPAAGETAAFGEPASPGDSIAADEPAAFSYHGTQRIRLLSIDSRGSEAAGLYGEPVSPGNTLQFRLEVEASKKLTKYLRVGGLLRISNEGEEVLDAGPQYLGSEWGSAFAEIAAKGASFRLGYYTLSMTPLTLMRWDWDDNPRVGGAAGCGCGASAGTLLVESLEELGPELTFEGAIASYGRGDLQARAFYGIPRRAIETTYSFYRSGAGAHAAYSLEIYGFETRWQRHDARTGGFWKAGAHALRTAEDKRSVDFRGLGYYAPDPWETTWIVSVTGEAPLIRHVRLRGEAVAWNWRADGIETALGMSAQASDGFGGFGGVVVEMPRWLEFTLDYLRLDPNFNSPFAALSYEANTEGLRAAARAWMPGEALSLSLFYKGLREVEVAAGERERSAVAGGSIDCRIAGDLGANVGWLEETSRREGTISPSREYRRAIAVGLHYNFGRAGVLQAQYQRIRNSGPSLEYEIVGETDLYSLYATVRF